MREKLPSWCNTRAVDRAAAACALRKQSWPDANAFRIRYGEGHLVHANLWRLALRLWAQRTVPRSVLAREDGRVIRGLAPPRLGCSLRQQCERLRRGLGPAVLFVEVGRSAECHGRAASGRVPRTAVGSDRRPAAYRVPLDGDERSDAQTVGAGVNGCSRGGVDLGSVRARSLAYVSGLDPFCGP